MNALVTGFMKSIANVDLHILSRHLLTNVSVGTFKHFIIFRCVYYSFIVESWFVSLSIVMSILICVFNLDAGFMDQEGPAFSVMEKVVVKLNRHKKWW